MNNKKKMVLGAAFVVAIMALAGIGYAAVTEYTGKTTNTTNSVDVEWIYLELSDGSAAKYSQSFNADVTFNTVNDAGSISFTPNGVTTIGTTKVVSLGSVVVNVTSSVTEGTKAFDLSMNNTAGTMNSTDGSYYISTNGTDLIAYTPGTGAEIADQETTSGSATITITLYWAPGDAYTKLSPPVVKLLDEVTFEFTATAETTE